jgi:hypothetical protein
VQFIPYYFFLASFFISLVSLPAQAFSVNIQPCQFDLFIQKSKLDTFYAPVNYHEKLGFKSIMGLFRSIRSGILARTVLKDSPDNQLLMEK